MSAAFNRVRSSIAYAKKFASWIGLTAFVWCSEAIAIPQNTTPTKVEPLSTKLDVSEAAKSTKPKNFAFVIAKHVILHQQQIISMDLIETILDEASKDSKIHPSFLLTNGGHTKEAALSDARWKWYGLSSRRFV